MPVVRTREQVAAPEQFVGMHVGHQQRAVQRVRRVGDDDMRRRHHHVHPSIHHARHDREGDDDGNAKENGHTGQQATPHANTPGLCTIVAGFFRHTESARYAGAC